MSVAAVRVTLRGAQVVEQGHVLHGRLPIGATTIIVAKPAARDVADVEPAKPEGAAAACQTAKLCYAVRRWRRR
ncbi:MAG TPA: hypothetical protein VFB88_14585, partial [Xanthobacteraceae bacterium]|nr:hypothetical protein [Xanthobacteraceae bacterium]